MVEGALTTCESTCLTCTHTRSIVAQEREIENTGREASREDQVLLLNFERNYSQAHMHLFRENIDMHIQNAKIKMTLQARVAIGTCRPPLVEGDQPATSPRDNRAT
jgi:hypothetical protein